LRSLDAAQSLPETGQDSNDGTIPKNGSWRVLPLRARRIENRIIPEEPFIYAAFRLWLSRFRAHHSAQLLGDEMLWVPELFCSTVRDSTQSARTRRSPVRRQNRLPHDQNMQFLVCIFLEKLFHCGGPPQTCRSSGGEQ
jgi:hypothetical protein